MRGERSRDLPRLHVVTDRVLAGADKLVATVAEAVAGGAGAVHLREKDLSARELLLLATELRAACPGACLLVNSRVDVALAANADGVQLPADGLPVGTARRMLGAGALIGCSVHSPPAARAAAAAGADFLLLGTIFATTSKPGAAPGGLELVATVTEACDVPVVAIGGITVENAGSVIRAGAYGVAVRGALLGASDPRAAARELAGSLAEGGV